MRPAWVARYIGLHYVPGGSSFNGCDCQGLVELAYRLERGVDGIFTPGPLWNPPTGEKTALAAMAREIGQYATAEMCRHCQIFPGEEREWDVALLRVRGHPMHLGLILPDGEMLHIEEGADSIIESYRGLRWGRKVVGFFRYGAEGGRDAG